MILHQLLHRLAATAAAALLLGGTPAQATEAPDTLAGQTFQRHVDASGGIALPEQARERWVHLGSWVVADSQAPGHGFHDVYTQPEAARVWRETGAFPDGAVLVKEIRGVNQGRLTTGLARWAGAVKVWFVMVRDRRGRFPEHPHWGEGWGWALFEADAPGRNVSEGFEASCRGCHLPARETGWVFTEGYPVPRQ